MATLSAQDRLDAVADYIRDDGVSITKADLRAAFNALDDWFDTNAATLNAVLPQPARSDLSTAQKARLLRAVIAKRYLSGV